MPTILVVEDDPLVREYVRSMLLRAEHAVLEAASLRSARQILGEHPVDLVITDLGLPDGDGQELVSWLRNYSDMPVLVMSGRRETPSLDADLFLRKPVTGPVLLAAVEDLLPLPQESVGELSVLLVDDDPLQAELVAERLGREGWIVHLAGGAEEALEQAHTLRPDAVVSDVVMPGLDGFELCASIRARPSLRDLPVVLLTALDVHPADRSLAHSVGANALVHRTPTLDELLLTLSALPRASTPTPIEGLPAYRHQLRDQLAGELRRRQRQERTTQGLAGRLATLAGLLEVFARAEGDALPLRELLRRYVDAPGLGLVAVYLPDAAGMFRLLEHASTHLYGRNDVEAFFGRADLLGAALTEDDILVDLDRSTGAFDALLDETGLKRLTLLPLVLSRTPIGVVAYGFDTDADADAPAFVRALQTPLVLLVRAWKEQQVTGLQLMDESINWESLG